MIDAAQILLLIVIAIMLFTDKKGYSLRKNKKPSIILDSCVLIDGRIKSICEAGFIHDTLVIPKFVVDELQFLADGQDSHKRSRARYGLDVVLDLQHSKFVDVEIDDTKLSHLSTTDDKLIHLARSRNASLLTMDVNLMKAANIANIKTPDMNRLSLAVRPELLPGEIVKVTVIKKGSTRNQGIGYSEDGTLIVIENGARHLHETIKVIISKMHQTSSGKMMFARLESEAKPGGKS